MFALYAGRKQRLTFMETGKAAEALVSCKYLAVILPFFKMLDTMRSVM